MRALDTRNKMSHTYSARTFEQASAQIRAEFFFLFEQLHQTLLKQKELS